MSNRPRNVTMLEELPDLADIVDTGDAMPYATASPYATTGGPGPQPPSQEQLQRVIRRSVRQFDPQAGMDPYDAELQQHIRQQQQQHSRMQQQGASPLYGDGPSPSPVPAPPSPGSQVDPLSLNCIDVARHIQECPVCSKLYANDRTVYIVVIAVLVIICLLLLKRVLNV